MYKENPYKDDEGLGLGVRKWPARIADNAFDYDDDDFIAPVVATDVATDDDGIDDGIDDRLVVRRDLITLTRISAPKDIVEKFKGRLKSSTVEEDDRWVKQGGSWYQVNTYFWTMKIYRSIPYRHKKLGLGDLRVHKNWIKNLLMIGSRVRLHWKPVGRFNENGQWVPGLRSAACVPNPEHPPLPCVMNDVWLLVLEFIKYTEMNEMGHDHAGDAGAGLDRARALFPYTAEGDDELTLKLGDELTILQRPSDNSRLDPGWLKGTLSDGRTGIFPENRVRMLGGAAAEAAAVGGGGGGGGAAAGAGLDRARALFPYTAKGDDELTFKTGDELTILQRPSDNPRLDTGWLKGTLSDGQTGIFPENRVRMLGGAAAEAREMGWDERRRIVASDDDSDD